MAATITPVVHGGRRARWAVSVALHAAGAGAAAAAFGALLGLAGAALGGPWGGAGLLALGAVAAAYAAREAFGAPVPVPERRRQVPEWWRTRFSPHVAALLYGVGLGVGFLTYLRHGTLVAVSAAAVVSGDPTTGALLVLPFGLARAFAVSAMGGAATPEQVRAAVDRLERIAVSPLPRAANGLALAAVAFLAVAAAREIDTLPALAAAIVAAAFAWAAAAKLLRWAAWRDSLEAHRLGGVGPLAAAVVPAAEIAVVALVLIGALPAAGALALALVAIFSASLVRARTGDRAPCACFGGARLRPLRVLLLRNAALAVVAGVALAAEPRPLAVPRPEALPAVLALLGVVAAVGLAFASARWLSAGAAGRTSPRLRGRGRSTPARTGAP